jgi:3-methyladenine DNA glycosylase AlkD
MGRLPSSRLREELFKNLQAEYPMEVLVAQFMAENGGQGVSVLKYFIDTARTYELIDPLSDPFIEEIHQ